MRSFTPVALFAAGSHAFWRMACPGRLTLQRIDPIITPGAISGHVHTVSGGSGFSFSSSYEQQRASVCSSCPIKADLSAYWTPKLYYMRQDGQFEDVPQSGEGSVNTGGLTVYYLQRSGKKPGSLQTETINAFPPGLRMVAGDPRQRNGSDAQAAPGRAISFVCLDYNNGSSTTYSLPNKNCPQGLRAQVFFPSCWNGQSNDTADHKSHMAYPIGHYDSGYCPDTHPIRLVSIFFEVTYNVGNFANRWYNSDGSHPFVFAQGDRTGYGFHGDFLNGWDTPTLQAAINQCNSNSGLLQYCPVFNNGLYSGDESESCEIPASVDEQTQGVLPALPGCNTPTVGPDYAPKSPANCAANLVSMNTIKPLYTDVTSTLGWSYVGCGNDSVSSRTFTGAYSSSSQMTIERCITTCAGKNFTLAGLQYGSQCFCDNQYNNQPNDYRAPIPGIWGQCGQPCAGNNQQICGGPSALSVYQVCTGISCANQPFQQFPGLVNQIVGGVTNGINGVINSTIPAVGSVVNSTVGDVTGAVNSTVGAVNSVVNSTVGDVNNILNNTLGAIGL